MLYRCYITGGHDGGSVVGGVGSDGGDGDVVGIVVVVVRMCQVEKEQISWRGRPR